MTEAEQRFGGIDVLVNNAGYGYRAAVEEGDEPDIRTLFETHVFGVVGLLKAVLPGMRARRSGAIVNISTVEHRDRRLRRHRRQATQRSRHRPRHPTR